MIEANVSGNSSIVWKPLGKFDWAGAVSLRQFVRNSLQPGVELVIDLTRVSSIDAVGMQALVCSIRVARAFGCTTRICNVRPPVQRLMDLVGVDRLLMRSSAARLNHVA